MDIRKSLSKCHSGRDIAAWLCLTPKQHSRGGKDQYDEELRDLPLQIKIIRNQVKIFHDNYYDRILY
jgi:hypothetical protein